MQLMGSGGNASSGGGPCCRSHQQAALLGGAAYTANVTRRSSLTQALLLVAGNPPGGGYSNLTGPLGGGGVCPSAPSGLTARDALTLLSMYLSAIIHDYDHRGVTNAFLIQDEDPLAVRHGGALWGFEVP